MTKKFIYNNADGDNEESPGAYEISDFINSSSGAPDAGKPIVLDANGKLDTSLISFDSISWKNPVRVGSTANVNISSPGLSIDSVTLAAGNRVLLKDQTIPTENGIYVFDTSTTPLTRASDFDEDSEVVAGSAVIVTEGMVNSDTCWIVTTNDPITIGVTDIVFGPLPLVAGSNYGIFPIWAEENGALGNNQREWSFGNGAVGDIGITLPVDAQLFAVSYQADTAGTNSEVSVEINALSVATTGPQSTNSGINVLTPSIQLSVGDVLGFRTILAGGASDVRVTAWLRIPLAALTDMSLDNLTDVFITAPSSGQVLYYNGTSWVNQLLDKNDVGLGNVDNTSDLDKPISTATQTALDAKIDKGGVCRIVNTGETYASIATAVSALTDYQTLHIFSQNSTQDIDLTGSNLSNVTFFGMGSSGTKNTVVGRVLLDSTCDSIEFHNIDMVTAGNDTVVDTGSTNTRFNECNISRTSGSVSVRISGSGTAAPAFSDCVITQDISLNGTNIFGFIYVKDSTIDDILSNSAQGAVIDRTLVNASLQFTGESYVEIRNTITPTIISSQPDIGFTSLVISNTHIRNPFTPGAVGIINKTGTAPYSLLDVDFDVAGSTLTGTDNSSSVPVSFAINCRGKNLADINALSRVAGTLHNAQDQSNKPYWDDGSTVNEIAYASSITPAPVDSVNGQTGTVVLDADDIDDSTTTNKYATQSQLDKVDFLTVTQAVDLDTLESDVALNNAKVSADGSIDTHSDVDLTGLADNDILVYDSGTSTFKPEPAPSGAVDSVNGQTGVVVLDADDIDDSTTTNKYATQAQLDKVDFLTVTQAVDLDTLESDVALNNAKVSADGSIGTHSDVDLTGLADNDILVYDSGTSTFKPEPAPSGAVDSVNGQTGVVVLDADDIDDSTTTNKYATQAQLDKVDFLTVTQAVDLDTLESDVATNNAKVSADGSIDTHSDVDLTGLSNDDILRYDSGTSTFKPEPVPPAPVSSVNLQVGVVVLDADDISDSTTTNKYATQAQLDKVDFLTVTQAVDLDTLESDVAVNNAKVSADGSIDTHSDVDLTGLADNDILVYDSGTSTFKPEPAPSGAVDSVNGQTGVVVLDADDIDDSTTTNKYATQAQLDKVDFLTVTQAVDLDTLESDVATNNAKVSASGSIDTHSDVDLTGLSDNDILVYDSGTSTFKPEPAPTAPVDSVNGQTGTVVLDADDIDDSTTTNKYATQAQLDKVDFITVTQAVDLDTIETDVAANNAKVSADGSIGTHSDVDLTGLSDNDILVYDSGTSTFKPEPAPSGAVDSVNGQTGVVVLDADDIDDSTTTNKYATQAQLDKVDFLTVTQAVDLDTLESDVATNNAKVSADGSVTTHNDVTSAGSGEIITNAERTKLTGIEPLAEVNNISDVDATDLTDGGDSSLHFHSSDRNRANHTGTQTASTISDFDTEVSNNPDVVANTAKVSADGSINTHSDVDTATVPPTNGDILRWNGTTNEWEPDSLVTTTFTYRKSFVAEQRQTATGKLSLGDGASINTMGVVITEDCTLVSVGISSAGVTNGTWDIFRNGTSIHSTAKPVSLTYVDNLTSPVTLNANDYLNATCLNAGGAAHTVTFEVEITKTITGFKGDQGAQGVPGTDGIAQVRTGNGAPSNTLGNDGDFYLDNTTGDYYTKSGGVWTLQGNLTGPAGGAANVLKLTNTFANNLNSNSTITFSAFNTTPLINDFGTDVSVANNGITFVTGGRFRVDFNFFLTSNSNRPNVLFRWAINGVEQIGRSAHNYIRNGSGHNESSSNLSEILDLSAGDVLSITCLRLAGAGTVTAAAGESIFQIVSM